MWHNVYNYRELLKGLAANSTNKSGEEIHWREPRQEAVREKVCILCGVMLSWGRHHVSWGRHHVSWGRHHVSWGRHHVSWGRHHVSWGRHHVSWVGIMLAGVGIM